MMYITITSLFVQVKLTEIPMKRQPHFKILYLRWGDFLPLSLKVDRGRFERHNLNPWTSFLAAIENRRRY